MWFPVLVIIAIIIIVAALAFSSSHSQSGARRRKHQSSGASARLTTPHDQSDESYSLHHNSDGTPYGAMDAEFEDWG